MVWHLPAHKCPKMGFGLIRKAFFFGAFRATVENPLPVRVEARGCPRPPSPPRKSPKLKGVVVLYLSSCTFAFHVVVVTQGSAKTDIEDKLGSTVLHLVAEKGLADCMELLLTVCSSHA